MYKGISVPAYVHAYVLYILANNLNRLLANAQTCQSCCDNICNGSVSLRAPLSVHYNLSVHGTQGLYAQSELRYNIPLLLCKYFGVYGVL